MYVAVKGGEAAIDNAHALLAEARRGDPAVPDLTVAQIREQMTLAVDRVMAEGSLYDPDLAALALKQARGDAVEAIFLVRAFRTTLPRLAHSLPVETGEMRAKRRISATFKDIPGGQILGPTFDYTHRLLDFALLDGETPPAAASAAAGPEAMPRVVDILGREGLIEADRPAPEGAEAGDLTRAPLEFPAGRDVRLQNLARGDEGFVLGLAYSSQRGFGSTHPFAGEIRVGTVEVEIVPEELGFPIVVGRVELTECQMISQFKGSKTQPPQFTRGYGLTFGHNERKAMAMAIVDRSLRADEFDEERRYPAQDEEFVLGHTDNVEASGFLQHLKLPHYVDFQGELVNIRALRRATQSARKQETAE